MNRYRDKLVAGMVRRGHARDFAERMFAQIEGFGSYGFSESHAASFAHLVYASAWVKCHRPAVFAWALGTEVPMTPDGRPGSAPFRPATGSGAW